MPAGSLQQCCGMKTAGEADGDDGAAKNLYPAPVLAAAAPLFQLGFVQGEGFAGHVARPQILKIRAIVAGKHLVDLGAGEALARTAVVLVIEAKCLRDCRVDDPAPPKSPHARGSSKEDAEISERSEPEEGEDRQTDNGADEIAVARLGLGFFAHGDLTLQERALIPNLVNTVKGYAGHEQETLEQVIVARNTAAEGSINSGDEAQLRVALDRLLALGEAYPDLKASANFQEL